MTVSTDFESGSGEGFLQIAPDLLSFRLSRKGGEPRPLWFFFQIEGAAGRKITFEIRNAGESWGDWHHIHPVISFDLERWERVEEVFAHHQFGILRFSHTFRSDKAWVAYCFPYSLSDLLRWIEGHKSSPHLVVERIGESEKGRPLLLLTITEGGEERGKGGVWVTARHHSGETPGSFVCEGMMEFLLSNHELAREARRRLVFKFVPTVDVDGVCEGFYGKNRPPVDFNRDWRSLKRPEIRAIKRAIDEWAGRGEYLMFLDLHAPTPSHPNHTYIVPERHCSPEFYRKQLEFLLLLEREAPADCPLPLSDREEKIVPDEEADPKGCMSTWSQFEEHGVLPFVIEATYQRTRAGNFVGPESLKALGAAVIRAIFRLFREH